MSLSDKEMIVLCKNNRREGYELLFTRYQRYIYSLCYNYIGLKEDALDLTQEIYIKLYRSMGQFDEMVNYSWENNKSEEVVNHDRDQDYVP